MVLRLPAGTSGLFFLRDSAILSSLRTAGETCKVERALTNANSSCLSMMLRQDSTINTVRYTPDRLAEAYAGITVPVLTSHHSR